jgi:vacuolar-type H+-ATPase catalytic subunit A/Vma1
MFNIKQIQKTEKDIALDDLVKLDKISEFAINQFISLTTDAYNAFWDNNPELKMQMLGTQALEVFTKSAQAQAFIQLINPDYIPKEIKEGYEINWNQDGSGEIIKIL